eukprot:4199856-Alexandrium_andersonii.AAC.1
MVPPVHAVGAIRGGSGGPAAQPLRSRRVRGGDRPLSAGNCMKLQETAGNRSKAAYTPPNF